MKFCWLVTVLFVSSFVASTLPAQTALLTHSKRPREHAGRNKLASATPKLRIVIYDFAHVDRSLVRNAMEVATDILKQSGIVTEWFDCGTSRDCNLRSEVVEFRLVIQPQVADLVKDRWQAIDLAETHTLGFAIPCNTEDMACLFYIFYSPISSLASQFGAGTGCVLGHVMVHEIGHALLGPDAHSRGGIMQPKFSIQATDRFLYFSDRESKIARDQLSMRNELVKNRLAEEYSIIVANSNH
jgi:hypothetical protein